MDFEVKNKESSSAELRNTDQSTSGFQVSSGFFLLFLCENSFLILMKFIEIKDEEVGEDEAAAPHIRVCSSVLNFHDLHLQLQLLVSA